MNQILSPEISQKIQFSLYRYRFVMTYVIFGGLSILIEIICFRGLEKVGLTPALSYAMGLSAGILFAYWMNVRFNFKVPSVKRNRAFLFFVSISLASASVNYLFRNQLERLGWSYESSRFVVAGCFFFVGYLFHRKYSFADYKKVGVAVYANGVEDIKGIYERIGAFPDFIHVDIVDSSFGKSDASPASYRLEVVHAYWPTRPIHLHIMSKTPSLWIRETARYVDEFFIHIEISEDVNETLSLIRSLGRKAGICVTMDTPLDRVKPYIHAVDSLMLLTISHPGMSGQAFNLDALDRIKEINSWEGRSNITLCVDGGVNEKIIGLLNVENVVSGYSVLNHPCPYRQIMRLQTSGNYEKV